MSDITHFHKIAENTEESAMELAMDIAEHDADFNGDNGEEYLWEKAESFDSNADYAWSIAKAESTPKKMLEKFFALWLSEDSYYTDYDWSIIEVENKLSVALYYATDN